MFRTRRPDCEGRCSMVTFVAAALLLYQFSLMDVSAVARIEMRVTAAACLLCAFRTPLARLIARLRAGRDGTALASREAFPPQTEDRE